MSQIDKQISTLNVQIETCRRTALTCRHHSLEARCVAEHFGLFLFLFFLAFCNTFSAFSYLLLFSCKCSFGGTRCDTAEGLGIRSSSGRGQRPAHVYCIYCLIGSAMPQNFVPGWFWIFDPCGFILRPAPHRQQQSWFKADPGIVVWYSHVLSPSMVLCIHMYPCVRLLGRCCGGMAC